MTFRITLFIVALAMFSWSAQAQVQKINTLAGNGAATFAGDGANAASASLWGPVDLALDSSLNLYIVDFYNFRVRKVNVSNIITTVAGDGTPGIGGDGTIGTSASASPKCVAVDRRGNLYYSDPVAAVIRKVNRYGIISHFAGGGPSSSTVRWGYTGDGGKADTARFNSPLGLAVDDSGNLFVADAGNNVIRRIDTFGKITTYAGNGSKGYSGNAGPALFARLDSPYAVCLDHYHNLYINDYRNGVIRQVNANGNIYTAVGDPLLPGRQGYSGDGGAGTSALIHDARGICNDTVGNLYIADAYNNVIRKWDPFADIITTVVGNGSAGFMGDLGYVDGCNLYNPYAVAVDMYGNIYIADANNNRVRKTYNPLSVHNIGLVAALSVYPNPGYNEITVSGISKRDVITVSDITGRQVSKWQSATEGSEAFNISDLAPGMYLVQVFGTDGSRKGVVKMVKE